MSAWESPRSRAINALAGSLPRDSVAAVVDEVFRQLADPDSDRDLLDAGIGELSRALAGGIDRRAARRIVEDVWRAMLESAQR